MPNDFQPVIGHEFTMAGTAHEKANFSGTVTWTLETEGTGTRVFLVQDGYSPDGAMHQMARGIMSGGWSRGILPKLGALPDA